MHDVTFDNDVGGFGQAFPVHFSGESSSYVAILDNRAINMGQSFSLMASVYRLDTGDFSIFLWDIADASESAAHFTVIGNELRVNVLFGSACIAQYKTFSKPLEINQWFKLMTSRSWQYISC